MKKVLSSIAKEKQSAQSEHCTGQRQEPCWPPQITAVLDASPESPGNKSDPCKYCPEKNNKNQNPTRTQLSAGYHL